MQFIRNDRRHCAYDTKKHACAAIFHDFSVCLCHFIGVSFSFFLLWLFYFCSNTTFLLFYSYKFFAFHFEITLMFYYIEFCLCHLKMIVGLCVHTYVCMYFTQIHIIFSKVLCPICLVFCCNIARIWIHYEIISNILSDKMYAYRSSVLTAATIIIFVIIVWLKICSLRLFILFVTWSDKMIFFLLLLLLQIIE